MSRYDGQATDRYEQSRSQPRNVFATAEEYVKYYSADDDRQAALLEHLYADLAR